ncbi:MAG: DUF2490 domain-containing protein [Nitrosomonadales bacterium]|nr:MAG: DUF2490 domain-containing protein [Nitrosomonadales bacterium]
MKNIKTTLILSTLLLTQSTLSHAAGQNDIFGVWGSVTLQGDFKALSPKLDKFKWSVMNQTRTRDDSPKGSRFTENLLFSQVGYQLTNNASFWVGYVHDWISPLNKSSYQESRPYQDFVWNQDISSFKIMSRSRMEQRVHETTGDTGYRARQFLQISHPLPLIAGLSAYVGEEVFFYMNSNTFGKKGFTENRVFSGLSYDATKKMGIDLGYMGQYVDTISGKNLFTHNIQVNFRHKF